MLGARSRGFKRWQLCILIFNSQLFMWRLKDVYHFLLRTTFLVYLTLLRVSDFIISFLMLFHEWLIQEEMWIEFFFYLSWMRRRKCRKVYSFERQGITKKVTDGIGVNGELRMFKKSGAWKERCSGKKRVVMTLKGIKSLSQKTWYSTNLLWSTNHSYI